MTTYDTDLKKSVADSTFRDAALFGIEASGATVLFGKSALRLPVAISDAPAEGLRSTTCPKVSRL